MKTFLDCMPCFLSQTLQVVRISTDDKNIHFLALKKVMEQLSSVSLTASPPEISREVYEAVRKITYVNDPYKKAKMEQNRLALALSSELKNIIKESDDPLYLALKLAIAGNIIDLGIKKRIDDLKGEIFNTINIPLSINHYPEFKKKILKAQTLLYLGDNAGEIVFDKIFIEEIKKIKNIKVTFVVRGAPIINDVTMADADFVKMDEVAEVVSNGFDAPGTILQRCDPIISELFSRADMVISKGQGNYESLSGQGKEIFFLLKAKCHVVARDIGVNEGDAILMAPYIAARSCISVTGDPPAMEEKIVSACGRSPGNTFEAPWNDEFGLIEKLLQHMPGIPEAGSIIKVPAGDDAALLSQINRPVITTDTQKEGVHFRLSWQTPAEIGSKAVEITLSDLAASYATPVAVFINLALPRYISERMVIDLYQGVKKALEKHNCVLGGGNISAADVFSLDLFAIGEAHAEIFPVRSGAKPGQGLFATGMLGLARAGLEALIKKDAGFEPLVDKFKFPVARFDAAAILLKNGVRTVIDISDGLAGDALHIARASNICIELDVSAVEFDDLLLSFCKKYSLDPVEIFISGGEDYELLFTCTDEIFATIKNDIPSAIMVGRCFPFAGRHLGNLPPGVSSFQHGL
ncbi:thiamine-phosphate kinase [Desulfosarcina sp. BuS5]|uniref:thiamine-phosphate kinase n=1 Tax=Desulfosarcina sp. BuS5 TaxID=933262 RepID=UPI000685DF68|nr:thiamine-phosphate kinase [Desulfosarcina sp. BuS5]